MAATRSARALLGATWADVRRPGNAALAVGGTLMFAVSVSPGFLRYVVNADRAGSYDPHYVEHMLMQVGGVLAGTGLSGIFLVLAAWAGLRGAPRVAAWIVVGVGAALDMVAMNPALDLFVDRHWQWHVAEHSSLFLLNILVGAAWATLLGRSALAVVSLSLVMVAMVAAGGGERAAAEAERPHMGPGPWPRMAGVGTAWRSAPWAAFPRRTRDGNRQVGRPRRETLPWGQWGRRRVVPRQPRTARPCAWDPQAGAGGVRPIHERMTGV